MRGEASNKALLIFLDLCLDGYSNGCKITDGRQCITTSDSGPSISKIIRLIFDFRLEECSRNFKAL